MVNFQGSILDSLLANYVKAHSHIIYIFLLFPNNNIIFVWTGRNEEDVFIELVFRFILHSLLNKPFVVITSVSFLHQMSEKYWKSYFAPKLFGKTFHNIIVKMSKLASLHGVKKKSLRQAWRAKQKCYMKFSKYTFNNFLTKKDYVCLKKISDLRFCVKEILFQWDLVFLQWNKSVFVWEHKNEWL